MTDDFIIVGSGIAGLYAALLASAHGRVLLVTKAALEESNTRYAQGGIAVALAPGDSPELHLRDTIAAGDGLCEPGRVGVLTREAPDCILDLLDRGVPFDRTGDELAWTREAAHSVPRILHSGGDATGAGIERTLVAAVRAAGVEILEHAICRDLIVESGRVAGVSLLLEDGTEAVARASAVILATGGAGQLYARTTNPPVATGDGGAMAFRAGAALADLEFFQFHPTAFALDGAPSFLISEAVRGEGGVLRNVRGVPFMDGYHPDRELAPRDVVARAIHQEMAATGSDHVFLDMTHLPADLVERRFPSINAFCRRHGIDPISDLVPVSPAAHYFMGGVWTDAWARTTLPGLYACGEVACTGVHGANRLASNSLLEGLVFARRAVESVVRGDSDVAESEGEPLARPMMTEAPGDPESREALARTMWDHAGLLRSHDSLRRARSEVERLNGALAAPAVMREQLEAGNLALLSSLLLHSASVREESRGAHYRTDFPRADRAWLGHILLTRDDARFLPLQGRARARLCA